MSDNVIDDFYNWGVFTNPSVQLFCKIIGYKNAYMKYNDGRSKFSKEGWGSTAFFHESEAPTDDVLEFELQPVDNDLVPFGETIRYKGRVTGREKLDEVVMIIVLKIYE